MNQEPNKNEKNNNFNNRFKKPSFLVYIMIFLIIIGIWVFSSGLLKNSSVVKIESLNEFKTLVHEEKVKTMIGTPVENNIDQYKVTGKYVDSNGKLVNYSIILHIDDLKDLKDYVTEQNIGTTYVEKSIPNNVFLGVVLTLLPYVILGFLFFLLIKSSSAGNNKAFDFGKNRAKLMREKSKTFADVAGCDEEKEELVEIVDFLKNPHKYTKLGARIPKGVLLVGPPGTGKTLLAKAVAGEANVPFFSISGSDFVEMFVGVGASRVRDLFKVAKENAPCIIFIDEIDAVGRERGAGMGGGHDEREQTLNQLLVEMDGFSNNSGVIIMAATNRPDVLDPALLRPGRFDRQITINTPDVHARVEILKVHARGKSFDESVNFEDIAQRIPGFSGADIENLLNEAALLIARANRTKITTSDIDEAIDRVMMGPAKKSRTITEKERKIVAYHEAGHAVIGLKLEDANVVQKVTIIPRGKAGGYNLMLPKEETYNSTKKQLLDSITGYLGGRVAEELTFNEITTGAYEDIKRATKIARAMVAEYGMSDLGPIQYEEQAGSVFLGRDYLKEKNFSDVVAHEIDGEVRKIIFECHNRATQVIKDNETLLKTIAEYLLKVETLTKSDIYEIESTGKLGWYEKKQAEKEANNSQQAPSSDDKALDNSEPKTEGTNENR